jgi:hypothetical protein
MINRALVSCFSYSLIERMQKQVTFLEFQSTKPSSHEVLIANLALVREPRDLRPLATRCPLTINHNL